MGPSPAMGSEAWRGCPGSTLAFNDGTLHIVREIRGAFFVTTKWPTLWAPMCAAALDMAKTDIEAIEVRTRARLQVVNRPWPPSSSGHHHRRLGTPHSL